MQTAAFALHGISSMATRQVLAELVSTFERQSDCAVTMEAVAGVDAAKRVQAGEVFDLVVLASDAIDRLITSGHLQAGSKLDLVRSGVAVCVRAGAPLPQIDSEDAVKRAVLAARSISYSTGPSGVALAKLFEHWGIADEIQDRMVQAPPGVPVGALVARGAVELGFQQLSELLNVEGITVLGPLPPAIQIITTFCAGVHASVAAGSAQAGRVHALLDYMRSPQAAEAKRRQGMEPA
ncbi:MAG: substrate-binding domain-containing protein [Polaromonas sp.]|uniref:substrate-binding domain-containing protein n=1 Tax=Polaromonas sp. TaxID=1869339 RepID=UPI002737220C|nr:substrate-binding domain-containing protein [Polaromonas sp.]MDP2817598.1 substrate-binding domain-containing protein [Polaromonas sp.]